MKINSCQIVIYLLKLRNSTTKKKENGTLFTYCFSCEVNFIPYLFHELLMIIKQDY